MSSSITQLCRPGGPVTTYPKPKPTEPNRHPTRLAKIDHFLNGDRGVTFANCQSGNNGAVTSRAPSFFLFFFFVVVDAAAMTPVCAPESHVVDVLISVKHSRCEQSNNNNEDEEAPHRCSSCQNIILLLAPQQALHSESKSGAVRGVNCQQAVFLRP